MTDELTCPGCGNTAESKAHLEEAHEVAELEFDGEEIALYGNRNLFLCRSCKRPLGVGERK
ncbi:hypothetical protein [Salinilacihabitans rarus]|uniref:hypothetical protein n=1 Tax=Salinilacihabitans rarus TaxID=2961596 RepID=UPI0020C8B0F2|nr:hypothetical protein [Salinilacihabitans rarus]